MGVAAILSIGGALAIAAANGANDNGKGVATLIGGGVMSARRALRIGHLATLAGAILSIFIARRMMNVFQGSGLLPDDLAGQLSVMTIVAIAAAVSVALATIFKFPISTTHALTGALVGVGLGATGSVSWSGLATKFMMPLLFSPVAAAALAALSYYLLHKVRLAMNVNEETCICVGERREWVPVTDSITDTVAQRSAGSSNVRSGELGFANTPVELRSISLGIGKADECRQRYVGKVLGISAATLLDGIHVVSATMLSAARGMNDTPKLAALAVGAVAWGTSGPAVGLVAAAMLTGGVLAAKRVTRTMSRDITEMNAGSGATANLVAATLVILASFFAMPVSTTHVTCGALFGIGAVNGRAHWRTVGTILLAWLVTLPVAGAIAALLATTL